MGGLYSYQGATPALLPRIPGTSTAVIFVNGQARTDEATLTSAELTAAGYTGPHTKPSHDPTTQHPAAWNGTAWTVADMTVAERKVYLKTKITETFQARRNAGTTASIGGNDVAVATTHEAAVELARAISKIQRTNPAGTIPVVTRGKARVTLTGAIATTMLEAIEDHVALCQARENALYGLVDDAETHADLNAIDHTTGWPT